MGNNIYIYTHIINRNGKKIELQINRWLVNPCAYYRKYPTRYIWQEFYQRTPKFILKNQRLVTINKTKISEQTSIVTAKRIMRSN
jgi:hypothetical protein